MTHALADHLLSWHTDWSWFLNATQCCLPCVIELPCVIANSTHQFLLTVANGIVNLKTGKLLGHERKHLLTHITDIAYDQSATAPTWLRFLEDVFQDDGELIAFVQKAVGYSLDGGRA